MITRAGLMSVFSDRRPLRQIGGVRAYLRQVAWSLWWRFDARGLAARRAGERSGRPSGQSPPSSPARRAEPARRPRGVH